MKVALAGAGAFGVKHLEAMAKIDGVQVVSLVGRTLDATKEVAARFGIGHVTTELDESLARPDRRRRDPVHAHADPREPDDRLPQGGQARAGGDPAGRSPGRRRRGRAACRRDRARSRWSATRGASIPSHQWVHKKIVAGEIAIQQMDVQTYFFRRKNINALGQARSWTDHLLWHHAAHTVDLFAYQTGGRIVAANAVQGPIHPELGIAHGHVDPAEEQHRARSARCRCRSTTTARSARSSATSATTAPTSRATTISSTARKRRSTCRRSMSR